MRNQLFVQLLNNIELIEKDGQGISEKNPICRLKGEETTSEKSDVVNLKLMAEVGK